MRTTHQFLSTLISLTIFSVSCRNIQKEDCGLDLEFPPSQYKYPSKVNSADTGFIYASYKDSLDKRDSFLYAFYGYHFFKSFEEPNLSLTPTGNTIVRISFDPTMDTPFVLTMTCNKIILKVFESGFTIPPEDISKLSKIEQLHYSILERHFPITSNFPAYYKKYIDSLIKESPELLSASYYRSLKEKSLNKDSFPMKYSTYQLSIYPEKFLYFINRLNSVNFWRLPTRMSLSPVPTDGDGYLLEIHTPNRYRMIISSNCPEISTELTKVCQELINEIAPKHRNLILCN